MSSWNTKTLPPKAYEEALLKVKEPLYNALKALQVIEAVLEKVLEVVKVFLQDLLNPIKTLFTLLLGFIRNLIAQIRSSGFSALFIIPDFTRPSMAGKLASVYGGFGIFKSQVIRKLYDTTDINRPSYPAGSAAAMLVVYVQLNNATALFSFVMSLVEFFGQQGKLTMSLPAPVDVSAVPALQSGSLISIARSLFDYDGNSDAVALTWRMPAEAVGKSVPNAIAPFVGIWNSYRHPTFLIERTTNAGGTGKYLPIKLESSTTSGTDQIELSGARPLPQTAILLDSDLSSKYQFFETKYYEDSAFRAGLGFALSTRYTFIDKDVKAGETYYYRIRAVSASAQDVESSVIPYSEITNSDIITAENSRWVKGNTTVPYIDYGGNVTMGAASTTVKITLPDILGKTWLFPEEDIAQYIMLGAMLNFELPFINVKDPNINPDYQDTTLVNQLIDLQTGYGVLSPLGSTLFTYKAFKTSKTYSESFAVRSYIRDIAGKIVSKLYESPGLANELFRLHQILQNEAILSSVFAPAASNDLLVVFDDYLARVEWTFPTINPSALLLGLSNADSAAILEYLKNPAVLPVDYQTSTEIRLVDGPLPLTFRGLDKRQRQVLADFLQNCVNLLGAKNQSLAWRSVTLAEFVPSLTTFLYDVEQYVFSILKSLDGLSKDIEDILNALILRIQQLQKIVQLIIAIIDILNIKLTFSALFVTTSDQGVAGLVSEFSSATNPPEQVSDSYYSGIVFTAGGPIGLTALQPLKIFLGLGEGNGSD